jgi:6-phosphogluconolactonase
MMRTKELSCLAVAVLACGRAATSDPEAPHAAAARDALTATSPLVSVPGSPFHSSAARNSNNVSLSPDEKWLFVSNDDGATVTVFGVGAGGALTLVGVHPTVGSMPAGMVTNPAGTLLYVLGANTGIAVHAIGADGSLTDVQRLPAPGPCFGFNGMVYARLPGGDVLYVNDNDSTGNHVSAFRVAADGTIAFLATVAAGDVAPSGNALGSPRIAFDATRHRVFATNVSSVAVYDAGADGSLTPVAGSPFALPLATNGAMVLDPSGATLYVGSTDGRVMRESVGGDGALSGSGAFATGVLTPDGMIDGLAIDPSGRYLVASRDNLAVLDLRSMAPVPGSPVTPDTPFVPSGLRFNRSGTLLFEGNSGREVDVSVYQFTLAQAAPTVSCVGTAAAPQIVPAAAACSATVDAAGGAAGTCTAGPSGLASCTYDGATSEALALGPHAVTVVATAPGGASATCTSYVSVVDATPPALDLTAMPLVTFPPPPSLPTLDLSPVIEDRCDPAPHLACDALGSTWPTTPPLTYGQLTLRFVTAALPRGTYTLACTGRDASGNAASAQRTFTATAPGQ